jgi:ribonuclease Z
MKVVFLGTGGTIPTERRKHPALALRRGGEVFLFDCGEGAQTRIFRARVGIAPIRAILVSHLHGDHVLGIPGLLMTMTQNNRSQPIMVIGPSGTDRWLTHIFKDLAFNPSFEVSIKEAQPGPVLVQSQYEIHAFALQHGTPTLGYRFEEKMRPGRFCVGAATGLGVPKGSLWGQLQSGRAVTLKDGREVHPREVLGPPRRGRKVIYAVDSRPCGETVEAASGADLLIHDGMFLSEDLDKAKARGHSTVKEAAEVASAAKVHRLVITHISPRYRGEENTFLKEATGLFPKTTVAEDLMELEIKYADSDS